MTKIEGYEYGSAVAAHSPVSITELRQLEACTGWTERDRDVLQKYARIFEDRAEAMLDSWRAIIGSQPHLAKWFFKPDGTPDEEYKAKVKKRFVQWVRDAVTRPHDQEWLDYQEEIGLRHAPLKKNITDGAQTPSVVPLRYLFSFAATVAVTTRKFFMEAGVGDGDLEMLQDAWLKTVILHVTLWSRPYCEPDWW